jgi:hypothetical protein
MSQRKNRLPRPLQHWLVSIKKPDTIVHAYVMTNDRDKFEAVLEKLIDLTDANKMLVPIALSTLLSEQDAALVRNFLLTEGSEEVKRVLREATDFHYSIWETTGDQFMELH